MDRIQLKPLSDKDRAMETVFIREQWGSTRMVSKGGMLLARDRTARIQIERNGNHVTCMKPTGVAPVKPIIPIEILNRVDIRVGRVELVEEVQHSAKLVKLTVDFGDHKRRILVGMKQERLNPKEIEGKQALFVVNLEPKRIMGDLSEGMLLDIGYADGIIPVLAVPERPVANGTRAR